MSEWPKVVDEYLHSSKEGNYEKANEIGLSEQAAANYRYTCYEVMLTLEVHEDGTAFITHVSGEPLANKVPA